MGIDQKRRSRAPSPSNSCISPISIFTHLIFGSLCFQLGLILGGDTFGDQESTGMNVLKSLHLPVNIKRFTNDNHETMANPSQVFPPTMSQLFAGAARVNRTDFASFVDVGVPMQQDQKGNEEVLILYTSEESFPEKSSEAVSMVPLAHFDTQTALQNCLAVKVILLQPRKRNECVAVIGQWESYYVHLFRRIPKLQPRQTDSNQKHFNYTPHKSYPLSYVSQAVRDDGTIGIGVESPSNHETNQYLPDLIEYLKNLNGTLSRLYPIAKAAAGNGRTVIVMVVNFGQSSLFVNFVCAARARGFDTSNVLLFATDTSTFEIAKSMNVYAFDVQDVFGLLPESSARKYGDNNFSRMMLAKVYSVHLVNQLGYNILFQDVDVVWKQNPLDFFDRPDMLEFDMMFQDDGSRQSRFRPWSPNSGFYFVRSNAKTSFFFNMFARMGDTTLRYRSHQAALSALLNEHSSWKGLRIKVFDKDSDLGYLFPGGYHFHRRKDYMKQMIKGKIHPFIFHMSWTENMKNKLLFMKQLGEWFVQSECENKKFDDLKLDFVTVKGDGEFDTLQQCCRTEPVLECHYRDKPSLIPCRGSNPLDKGRPSFW